MIDLDSALLANRTLVPLIYEAGTGTRPWNDALEPMAEFLDGEASMLSTSYLASGKGEVVAVHGLSADGVALFEREHAVNHWVRIAAAKPAGEVLHADRDISLKAMFEMPIGRDLVGPLGLTDGIGVKLTDSPLFVSAFSAFSRQGILPQRALDRLEFLTPHLAQAFALYQRFVALTTRNEALESGIDELANGVVFFDLDRSVLHTNALARSMADEQDGFSIRDDRLAFDDRDVEAQLEAAIAQAASPRPGEVQRGFFSVHRPSGRRPYHAVVSPAADTHGAGREPGNVLCLWLSDPDLPFVPSETSISTLLGLTPAESRIAAGLAQGQSVSEYATTAGITENTARSTLKHVFAKTGTRSQADLVRLITQSIPSMPY